MDEITKTEKLCELLLIQAGMVADGKLSHARRDKALVRLSQTMFELARPSFDGAKLSEALRGSCTEAPDVGSSAAFMEAAGQIYVNGVFDVARLSTLYFVGAPKIIGVAPDRKK